MWTSLTGTKNSEGTRNRTASWGILFLVFSASFLAQAPVLFPSTRPHLGFLNTSDFYSSLILYSSPFLCLISMAVTRTKHIRCGVIDLVYGGTVVMNAVSFFYFKKSGQIYDPVVLSTGAFFIYLFMRTLPRKWLKDNILILLLVPVIPAVAEACHAYLQWLHGQSPVIASYYNYNFLGMVLAMSVPLVFSQALTASRGNLYRAASLLLTVFLLLAVVMTTSRTAGCGLMIALSVAYAWRYADSFRAAWGRMGFFLQIVSAAGMTSVAFYLIYLVYSLRPLSVWGRILLAKIGLFMFGQHPIAGIGFAQIPVELARYQGSFFQSFNGTELERLLAGTPRAVTSVYLKTLVELGLLGLILYIPFWFLVLRTGLLLAGNHETENRETDQTGKNGNLFLRLSRRILKGEKNDMIGFGVGAVLILFMTISITYSPVRIAPVYLVFNYILGIGIVLLEGREQPKGF